MTVSHQRKIITLAVLAALSTGAAAQQVTLNSLDGTLSITGELIEYTNENYIIGSNIGNLTIATNAVTCTGDACPSLMPAYSEFTISGSRELGLNLMPTLLDGFAASLGLDLVQQSDSAGNPQYVLVDEGQNDVATISFVMRGSSNGMRDLLQGSASLALTTRPARQSEISAFSQAGFGNIRAPGNESIIALDGLVVVTSTMNRVRIIRHTDLAGIFSGQISDWAQLGGEPGPINLYVRPENSGTGSVFSQLIMRPARTGFSLRVNVMGSDDEVAQAVANDPNGIGFTSFSKGGNALPVSILGECGIQSPATGFTIQAEEYPYARRMYLYQIAQDVPPLVNLFSDYLETNDAQDLIDLSGYVGQDVEEVPVNNQGLRFLSAALPTDAEMTLEQLQSMMTDLAVAQRLSITYRFEQGTARLDSRALADINRLASHMLSPHLRNRRVILMGFTDSVGRSSINQPLSQARAEQVREALLAAGGGQIDPNRVEVRGYGELSPLGCNEDVDGRRINRRVEVWTR